MKKWFKWSLIVFVLFLLVVNYYAFLDIIEKALLDPLGKTLNSLGYYFSIKEPFRWILKLALPSFLLLTYATKISNHNFKEEGYKIYENITVSQLIILSLLLPLLLYFQNRIFGKLKESNGR